MDTVKIAGRDCMICENGIGGPVILYGTSAGHDNDAVKVAEAVKKCLERKEISYTYIAFLADDWNRDFSPWRALAPFGSEVFAGEGPLLLNWIREDMLPYINERFPKRCGLYLAGYSLAGLFSLWAGYETDIFSGIACCSGSLWYDGWLSYAQQNYIKHPCAIYLSLGGKEEKTKNPVMASIGERIREQAQLLKSDPLVLDTTLEMNPGGHFADPSGRMAKGISWLIGHKVG